MAAPPLSPRVDLLVDQVWRDITADVRDQGVRITRGRADEQASISPSRASFVIDNRSGDYSPRNPSGIYYGLIGRNSSVRVVTEEGKDDFGRTASNGWSTADSGQTWTRNGGDAADYAVGSGVGTIDVDTVNSIREMTLGVTATADITVSATVRAGVVATGGPIDLAVVARRADSSNYYFSVCRFNTDSTVDVLVYKRAAGVTTLLVSDLDTGLTYTGSTRLGIEFQCYGAKLAGRVWNVDSPSLGGTVVEVEDSALTAAGSVGVRAFLDATNTNTLPVVTRYDRFRMDDVRFCGEIPSWPPRWDVTGTDVWVPVEAAGLLRRLGQGSKPLRSPLYRSAVTNGFYSDGFATPYTYWPLEDAEGSTRGIEAFGGQPIAVTGTITFAANSDHPGSAALPSVLDGTLTALPPASALFNAAYEVGIWVKVDPGSATATSYPIRWESKNTTLRYWTVKADTPAGTVAVEVTSATGVTAAISPSVSVNLHDGEWHFIHVRVYQVGANEVSLRLRVDATTDTDTQVVGAVERPTRITVPALGPTQSNISSMYAGHLMTWIGEIGADADVYTAGLGHAGETAVDRMVRLADEEGVYLIAEGAAADSALVGPQRVATFLDLIKDAAEADLGILYEPRHAVGLAYRTRASLLNQSSALTLEYGVDPIIPPFEPVEDDLLVRNDVTATRRGGGSSRVAEDQGPLSTDDPPVGVGAYDESVTVNVSTDDQTTDVAGWRVHLGSWDEARFPSLGVELRRTEFTADGTLTAAAQGVDVGDLLTVTDLPSWLPPDDVQLLVQGCAETIDQFRRSVTWNCSPGEPYTVALWDDTAALWDTRYSTLASSFVAGVGTSMSVATESGRTLWTTGAVSFDIGVAGVRLAVTNIVGASSPQTFTVTATPVNGVAKTIPAGAQVRLWRSSRYS